MEIGLQQTMGNTAGIVVGQVYRKSPYVLGNSFSLGALVVAEAVIVANMLYLRGQNAEKERIARGEKEDQRKVRTGDREVDFKYHH